MAPQLVNGLDAVAKRIRSLMLSRRPATSDSLRHSVAIDAGRNINSSYQTKPGRQKTVAQTPADDNNNRRTSRNSNVTPSPYPPSGPNNVPSLIPFNTSFVVGDVVPNHAPRPHSILSLSYKRLLPNELSRLGPGDEIIIVLPPSNDVNSSAVSAATSAFHRVLHQSCPRMTPAQQEEHLQYALRSHEFKRRGSTAHEFCVCVLNFPEKQHLDRDFPNDRYAMSLMSQGAGYYVEVCGYSSGARLLIKCTTPFQYLLRA
jgi:hypothetical protein